MGQIEDGTDDEMGSAWYRNEDYPMDAWRHAVANDETRANYMTWVLSRYEEDDREPPPSFLKELEDQAEVQCSPLPQKYLTRYPEEQWRAEVDNIDTRLGYESWVVAQLQFDDEWLEECLRIDRSREGVRSWKTPPHPCLHHPIGRGCNPYRR